MEVLKETLKRWVERVGESMFWVFSYVLTRIFIVDYLRTKGIYYNFFVYSYSRFVNLIFIYVGFCLKI